MLFLNFQGSTGTGLNILGPLGMRFDFRVNNIINFGVNTFYAQGEGYMNPLGYKTLKKFAVVPGVYFYLIKKEKFELALSGSLGLNIRNYRLGQGNYFNETKYSNVPVYAATYRIEALTHLYVSENIGISAAIGAFGPVFSLGVVYRIQD